MSSGGRWVSCELISNVREDLSQNGSARCPDRSAEASLVTLFSLWRNRVRVKIRVISHHEKEDLTSDLRFESAVPLLRLSRALRSVVFSAPFSKEKWTTKDATVCFRIDSYRNKSNASTSCARTVRGAKSKHKDVRSRAPWVHVFQNLHVLFHAR